MSGCARLIYQPVDADLSMDESSDALDEFRDVLISHLAVMRNYPFAKLHRRGEYRFTGVESTADGREIVFVFEAVPAASRNHVTALTPYAYVYLGFRDDPYMTLSKNMLPLAQYTDDGDGPFLGTYKLMIRNASYCSGESRQRPVVKDGTVQIVPFNKLMRTSLYKKQSKLYTMTYCQGVPAHRGVSELDGVRFYFKEQESMEAFASSMLWAFPFIRVEQPE